MHASFHLRSRLVAAAFLATTLMPLGLRAAEPANERLRPPSVPLVLHDPYFSIWSPHDTLGGGDTTHWTGAAQRLTALARVDGATYRLMGAEPSSLPTLTQTSLEVTPTRTIYRFDHAASTLSLTFTTPSLPDDLDILSRPVTYVTFEATGRGDQKPSVQFYFDARTELCVNTRDQVTLAEHATIDGLLALRAGTVEQPVLAKQGDDLRIDWGYFYLATRMESDAASAIGTADGLRQRFAKSGRLVTTREAIVPVAAEKAPVLALAWDLGRLDEAANSVTALVAYDDLLAIRYFDDDLPPYWRRNGMDAAELLAKASAEQAAITARCLAFDQALTADAARVGGPRYAALVALCHRQSIGGSKLVADDNGQPLFFTKENHSNGCLGTVDVFYPQAPHLLLLSTALMKATLMPIMDYAASPRWKFDFAPHDMGRYPHATGQVYGGGEKTLDRQMMVEESANMLLLLAALAKAEGNAEFSLPYWPLLEKWAAYLERNGYDPENQLCTDDFAGHLARNVNLSAKAVCALGAFAQLATTAGKAERASRYAEVAKTLAAKWVADADDGGTHTTLAFGAPGTWSQKYNLAWDRVLGLNLFPRDMLDRELAYYKSVSKPYGLPLDSRSAYTKLDWIVWTATLANDRATFDALVDPIVRFVNETPDRSPLTDWYFTDSGKKKGFTGRPVVGGVFMPMIADAALWSAWSAKGAKANGPWAELRLRSVTAVAPTGEFEPATWQVASTKPADGWNQLDQEITGEWKPIELPMGVNSDSGTPIRSPWTARDVWAVREFEIAGSTDGELYVRVTNSGPFELWLNGKLAFESSGAVRGYQNYPISKEAAAALRPGKNILALHARSNGRPKPAFRDVIDVGLLSLGEATK